MTEESHDTTKQMEAHTFNGRPFGIILTRHVRSTLTNIYWNLCVTQLRNFYPDIPIVIIDDNSVQSYVKDLQDHESNKNIIVVQSSYPGAGELLPYYYLHKYKWFRHAAIIHDSVFFQKKINFQKLLSFKVLPFWHFRYMEDKDKCMYLASFLRNNDGIKYRLSEDQVSLFSIQSSEKWRGCFGCQCIIQYDFLHQIQKKYNLFGLINIIKDRKHRMCLERIMGAIFSAESPNLSKTPSLLGDIWKYQKWNIGYDTYVHNKQAFSHLPIVKVWSGR